MFRSLLSLVFSLAIISPIFASSFEDKIAAINDLESKTEQIEQLNALAKNTTISPEQKFQTLKQLIFAYADQGNLKQARETALLAAKVSGIAGLLEQEAEALKYVGAMHYYMGNHQDAINAYQTSQELYQPLNLPVKSAHLLNNLGLVYSELGDYRKALDYYQEADKLYQAYGDIADKLDIKQNIAGLHIKLSQFEIAISILTELEVAYKNNDLISDLAMSKSNMAVALKRAGKYELARDKALESLKLYRQQGSPYDQAIQLHNLSDIYFYLGQPAAAMNYAERAVALSKEQSNQRVLAGALNSLAKGYLYRKQYDKSLELIDESDRIASDMGYQQALIDNLGLRSLISAANSDIKSSLTAFHSFTSSLGAKSNNLLNEQLAKFESDRLELRIEQLELSKKQQNAYDKQIRFYLFVGFGFCLVITFMLYRKYLDSKMKKDLESMIKNRTEQLLMANKQLLDLSLLDSLTKVHNRRSFDKDIAQLWKETQTIKGDFLLIFTDIDYFKKFNDHYGHLEGDKALKQVAKTIQGLIRDGDRVYRYGGEEFAIIMTNHNLNAAKTIFERIQKAIRQLNISNEESEHRVLTLSAGISQSLEVKTARDMVDLADKRLYQAKALGRNCLIDKLAG